MPTEEQLKSATKSPKSRKNIKPSLQIYRPPGLRNSVNSKSGLKDSDQASNTSSGSRSSDVSDLVKSFDSRVPKPQPLSLNKLMNDEKSSPSNVVLTRNKSKIILKSTIIKDIKKKQFTKKDEEEALNMLRDLNFVGEKGLINEFISSGMNDETLAFSLAQSLVHFAVEEKKQGGRMVARISAIILSSPSGEVFHKGFIETLTQYYERRDELRTDHLRIWTNFLSFISDLYSCIGFTYEGGLVNIIFNVFDYLLKNPVLETLKIEELECMLSSLLSVGYDLERNYPDQLGNLKNAIRNAFIDAHEPWARKMILLLIELCASGWNLSTDANEYYFG